MSDLLRRIFQLRYFHLQHNLFVIFAGLATLIKIQTQSPGLLSAEAEARIRETIIRIGEYKYKFYIYTPLRS